MKTAINRDSVKIDIQGAQGAWRCDTSANGQFLTLIPREYWTGEKGGKISLRIRGSFDQDFFRLGLKFFLGSHGGDFDQTYEFQVRPRTGDNLPFKVPQKPGDAASVIELSRLAPANPAILPSYNQIGYDSLHYILGAVEGDGSRAILWGVGGMLSGTDGTTRINPELEVRFPMMVEVDRGLVTLYNDDGILLDMNGAWDMPIELFRIAGRLDEAGGRASVNAVVACDRIEFYGHFLKLLGMSEFDTGRMFIYGGADLSPFGSGETPGPGFGGQTRFGRAGGEVFVEILSHRLPRADHVHSLLLVDTRTGRPVPLPYIDNTLVETDERGGVKRVSLKMGEKPLTGKARAYYLVDTYPAARGEVGKD